MSKHDIVGVNLEKSVVLLSNDEIIPIDELIYTSMDDPGPASIVAGPCALGKYYVLDVRAFRPATIH